MALRVGVVGLGRGAVLHRALALQPGCEVIAVSSRSLITAQAYAAANGVPRAYGSYAELLADQDVNTVVVASPAPHHAEQSIAALRAGKHVISEVPAAYTLEECAALVAAAEEARGRVTYLFAENANYAAQMQSWQGIVKGGLIGKIIYAESQYIHDLRDRLRDASGQLTWRAHLPPIHYCTHEIGPILALLAAGGQRDRCVWATGLHTGSSLAPDIGSIDLEVGLFRTAGGVVIKVLCAFSIAREPWGHTRTVYGTHGCLESGQPGQDGRGSSGSLGYFDQVPHLEGMMSLPIGSTRRHAPPEALVAGGHGDGEYWMARDFVRCLLGETPPPIDVYDAMDYTVPGICAHLSAERGGAPVDIPDFRTHAG